MPMGMSGVLACKGHGTRVLISMSLLMAVAGCSAKKGSGADGALGESDLSGAARGSSLEQWRSGNLGSSESGPLESVLFDYDSYSLSPEARAILEANAEWLQANSAARVEVEGHCDDRGTIEYNLALGAKRANAARDYLEALGVATNRLTTISYGKELPICREQSPECLARNRRDRFVVLD